MPVFSYDSAHAEVVAKALLIRRMENRLLQLFSEGKLFGTVHTCVGQELIGVAIAEYLDANDWVFSNHRGHGHFVAKTNRVEELIAEIMGKATGVCGGWGGSQHLCADRFFSNGIQGGIVPIAAGLALGEMLQDQKNISVVFVGEGTLGEGVVYETANLTSKWDLPLLIVLENNRYSQSTHENEVIAGSIPQRFSAFGIECFEADTWNIASLLENSEQAVRFVREQRRPAFLRVKTDRLMAHSKGDDDRPAVELDQYWARDYLSLFQSERPDLAKQHLATIDARIDAAVESAINADIAHVGTYEDNSQVIPCQWELSPLDEKRRFVEILRDCFHRWMEKDERIVMLGEDIRSPYGGAFKVTKGLSDAYPRRVLNTSISEAAIVGLGNGLALHGMRPVCEIMFGDFLTLAFDQIANHASKFQKMYNDQVSVPLIVRTPMGGGRGYGPTHSQSIEKHFLGLPQTQVLALHGQVSPALIYDRLFQSIDRMTLVIENKLLYSQRLGQDSHNGFVWEFSDEQFPTCRLRPEAPPDLTIACYGGMLGVAEKAAIAAFDEHEIACEIVCPVRLFPMNVAPFLESVLRSRRLLVLEEGQSFAGWGAELFSQIHTHCPAGVDKLSRCAALPLPIPTSGPLEQKVLPNFERILDSILEAMADA